MAKSFQHRLEEDDMGDLMALERQNIEMLTTRPTQRVLPIAAIRRDGPTQPRASLDADTVTEYMGRMRWDDLSGEVSDPEHRTWEPLTLYFDGADFWLADGFHRVEAASKSGIDRFQAIVHQGSLRDAVAFSLGANARHGKRRTNADKRRAVTRALQDEEWGTYSDNKLAGLCAVSQPFVGKLRRELLGEGHIEATTVREGSDGHLYEVAESLVEAPKAAKRSKPQARETTLKFSELGTKAHAIDSDLVIAWPDDVDDWGALVAHIATLLAEDAVLVVYAGRQGELFQENLALHELTQAGDLGTPRWMHLSGEQALVFVWSRGELRAPKRLASLGPLMGKTNHMCTIRR